MESFFTIEGLINLITLTGLEIILGIDNVIFISLLVQPLNEAIKTKVRVLGLSLALILRILMLFSASWITTLTKPLFSLLGFPFSGRSLLLIIGGLFLVIKGILEIKSMLVGEEEHKFISTSNKILKVALQIVFIDFILSFDSIITAVGLSNNLPIIITAILISMVLMLLSSRPIGNFISRYPNLKVIALNFIILVGIFLVGNGLEYEIPKGYLYFAIFFAGITEALNILISKKNK